MKLIVTVVCSLLIQICSSNTDEVTEQDIDEIMYQDSLTAPVCKSSEFDCGNKCIDIDLVCDGKHDCPGGNDEYNEFCIIDHKNASCLYPHLPPDRYKIILNYTSRDKHKVPEYVQGLFKCNEGYFGDTVNEIVSTCIQRSWEPPIISCQKICPQINNAELEQSCFRQNQVDCNDIIWEGTVVKFTCQKSYLAPTFNKAMCLPNGKWSLNPNEIQCHLIRGRITVETATALKHKDFPWRVLIREHVNQSVRYFSGTLIDKKMILTDGDLFTRSKLPRDFDILVNDDVESWGPQKSYKIRIIHFLPAKHQTFLSPDSLGNLAILEPYEEIEYSLTVIPAAILPFSYPASWRTFKNAGIMAILNDSEDVQLFYDTSIVGLKTFAGICKINRERCNQYCGQLLNEDNGALLNEINSGNGLIKFHNELKLYFLEGVYSKQHPKSNTSLIFTFVSDYIEWIDEIRERTKYNKTTLIEKVPQMVKQLKSTSHSTSYYNILTTLLLLSFVILIAVGFRIIDYHSVLKITRWWF